MKTAVVKISDIGSGCMSARRFTGGCHECERLERCKEKESKAAKKKKIRHKIATLKEVISMLEDKLKED